MNHDLTRRLAPIIGAVGIGLAVLAGCAPEPEALTRVSTERASLLPLTPAPAVVGDPNNGRRLFTDARITPPNGCGSCHTLRGVSTATGIIGPNLTNVGLRPTLAGETIQNTPEQMARWIMNAPGLKQGARMPPLNVSEQDARDLAAFLFSQPYNPPAH